MSFSALGPASCAYYSQAGGGQLLTARMLRPKKTLTVRSAAEIGGFGHHDWLQLDAYFDTERLKRTLKPHALVTVEQYVKSMRCSRRAAPSAADVQQHRTPGSSLRSESTAEGESAPIDVKLDAARRLDALVVFMWWEEERKDLTFLPALGLTDCAEYLLSKGHIRRVPPQYQLKGSKTWFAVQNMSEGTDNRTIDAPNMMFGRVLCADPYSLDHSRPDLHQPPHAWPEAWVEADSRWLSRGQWFSAVSHYLRTRTLDQKSVSGSQGAGGGGGGGGKGDGQSGGVIAIALASYRRTALVYI